MLNQLQQFVRQYQLLQPGDQVVCAVSGGADSVALLFALYLLREKWGITLSAAHFNHGLRGQESDRDEAFVRNLCDRYQIPVHVERGCVVAGQKGLEAAARDARYAFLNRLPGKIATAHTADDNAETVLMHMVRGTGLKGLGGITPAGPKLIRPMLTVTRQQVLAFLREYHLDWVEDSSNAQDSFLRNRLRRHVMPLLQQENPRLAQNLSAMALRLRQDQAALETMVRPETDVQALQAMPEALRSRCLGALLERWGVPEPEAEHIALAEKLVFSRKPSARAVFPGGVTVRRNYGVLERAEEETLLTPCQLPCPGKLRLPGLQITCAPATELADTPDAFCVQPSGPLTVRCRQEGDTMTLHGGTKSLKKIFIDRKIPASKRSAIPVIADDQGILGVYTIGADRTRLAEKLPAVLLRFDQTEERSSL